MVLQNGTGQTWVPQGSRGRLRPWVLEPAPPSSKVAKLADFGVRNGHQRSRPAGAPAPTRATRGRCASSAVFAGPSSSAACPLHCQVVFAGAPQTAPTRRGSGQCGVAAGPRDLSVGPLEFKDPAVENVSEYARLTYWKQVKPALYALGRPFLALLTMGGVLIYLHVRLTAVSSTPDDVAVRDDA